MFVHQITPELALKLISPTDADAIFALTDKNRTYLREWLPWLDTTMTVADTQAYIQHCLTGYAANTSLTTLILYQGQPAGVAGFNTLNWANQTAYIGYWLSADQQGNGIMTTVARALTDYAFQTLHLNKVEIRAAASNHKSRQIPERLGFVNEGCLRQAEWLYDHFVDHMVYGMLQTDWPAKSC